MKLFSLLTILLFGALLSCQSPSSQPVQNGKNATVDFTSGESVYNKHCAVCHQANGMGIVKVFPPLKNNNRLGDDASRLIDVMLSGMAGEIEINGEKYNGIMAPYQNLSDTEIADVLNYVRLKLNTFEVEPILPEAVEKARRSL